MFQDTFNNVMCLKNPKTFLFFAAQNKTPKLVSDLYARNIKVDNL